MSQLLEVRAIVRVNLLDRVVHAVKAAGIPRLTVYRVHAIGAGVDHSVGRFSLDEGSEYVDKAVVQFIAPEVLARSAVTALVPVAQTGRRGDGIVAIYPVEDVIKIRTGERGESALA